MRNKVDLQQEINELQDTIRSYKRDLIDIEDSINYLLREIDAIESESLSKVRLYDLTQGNEWRGNLEEEAERFQGIIIDNLIVAQEDSRHLVCDLRSVEKTIHQLIEEALERIALLEMEMCIA